MKIQYTATLVEEVTYSEENYGPLADGETEEMCVMRIEQINKADAFEQAFSNGAVPLDDIKLEIL